MGLLKGSVTFSQYRITGDLPEHFNDFFDNRIKKNAFQNVFASMMEEKTMGWTGIENIIDTDFQHARHTWGKYLLFSLRIDRKVIPPSLLRIRCLEAERDYRHVSRVSKPNEKRGQTLWVCPRGVLQVSA